MRARNSAPRGQDISIVKLVPRNERKIAKKYLQRIEASLRAGGLIEQLIVFSTRFLKPHHYQFGNSLLDWAIDEQLIPRATNRDVRDLLLGIGWAWLD